MNVFCTEFSVKWIDDINPQGRSVGILMIRPFCRQTQNLPPPAGTLLNCDKDLGPFTPDECESESAINNSIRIHLSTASLSFFRHRFYVSPFNGVNDPFTHYWGDESVIVSFLDKHGMFTPEQCTKKYGHLRDTWLWYKHCWYCYSLIIVVNERFRLWFECRSCRFEYPVIKMVTVTTSLQWKIVFEMSFRTDITCNFN